MVTGSFLWRIPPPRTSSGTARVQEPPHVCVSSRHQMELPGQLSKMSSVETPGDMRFVFRCDFSRSGGHFLQCVEQLGSYWPHW